MSHIVRKPIYTVGNLTNLFSIEETFKIVQVNTNEFSYGKVHCQFYVHKLKYFEKL